MGPIETAVRSSLSEGAILKTPTQGQPFIVETIDSRGVVLLIGAKRTRTAFSWSVLEDVDTAFRNQGWVVIGGRRDVEGNPGTLDGYLKSYVKRDTAGWVASLLQSAGVVDIDRTRPGRIRVTGSFGDSSTSL